MSACACVCVSLHCVCNPFAQNTFAQTLSIAFDFAECQNCFHQILCTSPPIVFPLFEWAIFFVFAGLTFLRCECFAHSHIVSARVIEIYVHADISLPILLLHLSRLLLVRTSFNVVINRFSFTAPYLGGADDPIH